MEKGDGNIPVLFSRGTTLGESWEKSILELWDNGIEIATEYDKPGDPLSKDATLVWVAEQPFAEPRVHRWFIGGPSELESYRREVIDGIHDNEINPKEGKWKYTYHERLFDYNPSKGFNLPNRGLLLDKGFDQIKDIVNKLAKTTYSRRAQATTWMPTADPELSDPPCLQSVWCRLLRDNQGNLVLNMNTRWRSRDAWRAAFMNAYALTDMQGIIASDISGIINEEVKVGRYCDMNDSYHIYGMSMTDPTTGITPKRVEMMRTRPYSSRAWRSDDSVFLEPTLDARAKLSKDPNYFLRGGK